MESYKAEGDPGRGASLLSRGIKCWPDLLVFVLCIVVAFLYYNQRVGHDRIITNLKGDAQMIASVFAGRDHRADFAGDPLLGESETTDIYITVAYWYVSLLQRWFDIPYGDAYVSMFVPIIVVHLFGFYLFGRILCGSRILAVLLAVSSSLLINFDSWGEFWGLFSREPLNRVMFGALVGIFWSAAIYYGRKPIMRPIIMAAVGLSLWVHSVAVPVLGFSIWLGFWAMRSEDETLSKFVMNMLLSAGIFLLILLPYTLQYASSFGHAEVPPSLKMDLLEIMRNGYIDGYFRNELAVIKRFFYQYGWQKQFLSLALIALVGTILLGGAKDRRTAFQFGLMAAGILSVADALFLYDHYQAMQTGRFPFQADLVRGNRFLIPLSFAVLYHSSAVVSRRLGIKYGAPVALIVVVFLFFHLQPNLKEAYQKLHQGYDVSTHAGSPSNDPDVEMLTWLREQTPRKTSVTAFFNDLLDNTVRYVSLRPLKFSFKDACFYNYFSWEKALEYQQKRALYEQAMEQQDRDRRFQSAVKTALIFGSQLMVIDKGLFDASYQKAHDALLWENAKYSVIDLGQIRNLSIDSKHPEFKVFTTLSAYDHEVQPCMYYIPPTKGPHPLIVYLHNWSGTALDDSYVLQMFELARERGYAILSPNFRGRNSRPEATGSELAVADVLSAVNKMCALYSIDSGQIHLIGASGGGYMSLLMAGRTPHLWKSAIAWCPIYDLKAWCQESERNDKAHVYADDIKRSLSMEAKGSIGEAYFTRLARLRSPTGWLQNAGTIPIHIFVGINDGHGDNYVPISHSINAYNCLAAPQDRLSDSAIKEMTENRIIPKELQMETGKVIKNSKAGSGSKDVHNDRKILLYKASHKVSLTVFAGAHEMLPEENFRLLGKIDHH